MPNTVKTYISIKLLDFLKKNYGFWCKIVVLHLIQCRISCWFWNWFYFECATNGSGIRIKNDIICYQFQNIWFNIYVLYNYPWTICRTFKMNQSQNQHEILRWIRCNTTILHQIPYFFSKNPTIWYICRLLGYWA